MSIRFVLGPSGSGKSTYLQKLLIDEDVRGSERKLLLIVPDQYTMQTQKDMILMHPDRAFSDIEVLSFSRLSHRILEELGGDDTPVLDDTGKSLIIRHVAEGIAGELPVMGKRLDRIGFIHEVKSAISEFMQYGIGPDELHSLAAEVSQRKALAAKLRDLECIYRAFLRYKSDNFLTREESLDLVRKSLHNSELVKGALIVFDGFTGFTPIQERLIQELMLYAEKVIFSFTMEEGCSPGQAKGEQELFGLSARSAMRLGKLADQAGVPEEDPVYTHREVREKNVSPELVHLERSLFRYPYETCGGEPEHIRIYRASGIREEITDTFQRIVEYTSGRGMRYRDIAVVAGDLSEYADDITEISGEFGVPVYLDYSRSIMQSPFVEAIRSAYEVIEHDYTAETLLRHLRCGFGPLTREECDELENFLLRTGIRGRRSYEKTWVIRPDLEKETGYGRDHRLALEERLNSCRERLLIYFGSLHNIENKKDAGRDPESGEALTVEDHARMLYEFLDNAGMEGKLKSMSAILKDRGDISRSMEYDQIYGRIMELLDQITSLTGSEKMGRSEFAEILEAGFGEIKLGVIPQESDTVKVGDLIRSRLSGVKALFILGVNDCNIPGGISSGGIISDMDREFIKNNTDAELAPTPREQMFTQRMYLYMNLTKPSEELVLSYACTDSEGKSMRPSYLVDSLLHIYPQLTVRESAETHMCGGAVMPAGAHLMQLDYAGKLRDYVMDRLDDDDCRRLEVLAKVLRTHGDLVPEQAVRRAAFAHYRSAVLSRETADRLYGKTISTSVSRLEKFASCAYAHFLTYGMRLRDRTEYGFERRDMGDVFHKVLEEFAERLKERNIGWTEYTAEMSHAWVDEFLNDIAMTYGETVMISDSRTKAMTARLGRILRRTVDTLQYQAAAGDFEPVLFEKKFSTERNLNIPGAGQSKMVLSGKIDRIDVCDKDDGRMVRVIDYKSGNRSFDIAALKNGLMLQLAVYMDRAALLTESERRAGMLYYHISDPVVDGDGGTEDEEVLDKIHKELRMKGMLNADPVMLAAMDRSLGAGAGVNSDIVPAGYKKDGSFTESASVLDDEDFRLITDYAMEKTAELSAQILTGDISVHPCAMKDKKDAPCTFCDYSRVCRIDSGAPGYVLTVIKETPEAALEGIRERAAAAVKESGSGDTAGPDGE